MAKVSEKDDKDVSAFKIYDLLHTDRILDDLFWEMMSDIKGKKAYKRLMEMVDNLISKHKNVLASSFNGSNVESTAVIKEICMMAYTIDTILPNLLFFKLKNEFPAIIKNIIEELENEKKIDKNIVPSQINDDIVKSIPSGSSPAAVNALSENAVISTKSSSVKSIPQTSTPLKSISKSSPAPVGDSSKKISMQKDDVPSKSQTRNGKNVKSNKTKGKKEISKKGQQVVENDGDTESIGVLSFTSVSSVHTSELSSFDDVISLSSDDEENGRKRKRLSLGEIQHMYQNGRISDWCAENLNGMKYGKSAQIAKVNGNIKEVESKRSVRELESRKHETEESSSAKVVKNFKPNTEVEPEETVASSPSVLTQLSSPQKTLPPRIRKPNSKYSSDSILCPITQKQQKRAQKSDALNGKSAGPALQLPQKRKQIKSEESNENLEIEPASKQHHSNAEKDVAPNSKCPKTSSSSDLYKPHSAVRLLTSRRSAPVTLFSTSTPNPKKL